MKTINITLITALISFFGTTSFAQNQLADLEYGAYLNASKTLWKKAVSQRQSIYDKSVKLTDLFNLVSAQYGLLNSTMASSDEELFDQYVDSTKENLGKLIDSNHKLAESKAILSAIYGLEISYSTEKGMYLGPKSGAMIDDAHKISKTSPLVWQLYGNSKLFTPAMFGGDENEAIKAFEKSVELYENDSLKYNWRYLDALAWLGQAYIKTGQPEKARATFEKALKTEPDFNWVKNVLLPKVKSN